MMSNTPHEILGVLYTTCAILRSLNASTQINIFFTQIINPLNSMVRNIYLNVIGNIATFQQAEQENNQEKTELSLKALIIKLFFKFFLLKFSYFLKKPGNLAYLD